MAGILLVIGGLWAAAVYLNRRRWRRLNRTGKRDEGIVVFVEPVRWLFVVWGFAWFCRGLRQAGGRQYVHLFRWSSIAGALLVVPDLVNRRRLDRLAARLVKHLLRLRRRHPHVPIHVVGYSTGAYVASEACKRIPPLNGRLVLLAPSASPAYDWSGLADHGVAVHSFHSPFDLINVLGPALFGSNDRRWGPAAGAVGFRQAPPSVAQRPWRLSDAALGYLGDHFTVAAPAFVARHVAPLLS
ncbi:MAG TPA: hypothetical protein PKL76_13990 [Phycisphaerae bacterium]|nr:hypothetical protein [Phycisphaerae bacterium]